MALTNVTWSLNGSGAFNLATNWSGDAVPGLPDAVTIAPSAAAVITISGTDAAVGALTLGASADLVVEDNTSLTVGTSTLSSTFANAGTLSLNSTGDTAELIIGAKSLTLSGSGTVLLGNDAHDVVAGASTSAVLDNTGNLIEGAGQFGNASLSFTNGATGIVDANGSNALTLNTAAATISNGGLLEATGSGGLVIDSSVSNGSAGNIDAAGGDVFFQGVKVSGGTLQASLGAEIIFASGGNTLNGASDTVTLKGAVAVARNTSLALVGTIDNSGSISTQASDGYGVSLVVGPTAAPGTMTLSGAGALTLSDDRNNAIVAGAAGDTLVSLNIVTGAGQIGEGGSLSIVNGGTIDATGLNALTIDTATSLINDKLLEATGLGGLVLTGAIRNGTAGTISAAGGVVSLQGADVTGGLLEASAGGAINVTSSSTLDGTAHTVTIKDLVTVQSNTSLDLLGTVTNASTILLAADNGYGVNLNVGPTAAAGTLVLTGSGALTLSDDRNNSVLAAVAGDTLLNLNNTISGAGLIGGGGSLTVVNDATIDANGTNALVINVADALTNNHLIEATGLGGLVLTGTFDNGASGTISAAGGTVTLQGADIEGGALVHGGAGLFVDSSSVTLDGSASAIANSSIILVENDSALNVLGTVSNTGSILLAASGGYGVNFYVGPATAPGTVTLTGAGHLTLSDDRNNGILAAYAGATLINLNNTISGAGLIGNGGSLTVVNDSLINANGTNAITINVADAFTNNDLIETTGPGGLVLTGIFENNAAGTIAAAGGTVTLSGADIVGGTLTHAGSGLFIENTSSTLDGSANEIVSSSTIVTEADTALTVLGTIDNSGSILLDATSGYGATLYAGPAEAGTVTLTGSGNLMLSDDTNNYILGGAAGDTLVNLNNTITGAGNIGNGNAFDFVNDATIDANGFNALTIDSSGLFTNNSLVEATGSGGIVVQSTISNGASGTLSAIADTITLAGGADIKGGLLNAISGGAFVETSSATLNGTANALTSNGQIVVENDTSLYLLGTIANSGTISMQAADGYGDSLYAGPGGTAGTVTLSGGGVVTMTDDVSNTIAATLAGDTLDNVNNTLVGAGDIGANGMDLINGGTIETNTIGSLTVQLGSLSTNLAGGLFLADGATSTPYAQTGTLLLENGTFLNDGTIEALDGGSVVQESTATLKNDHNGTLTGGTYSAISQGALAIAGNDLVSVDAADIVLDQGSIVTGVAGGGSAQISATLTDVTSAGTLQVLGGSNFDAATNGTLNAFKDSGTIVLGGGAFTSDGLTIGAGALFSGSGTVSAAITNSGTIAASGGTLSIAGVLGSGVLQVGSGGTLLLVAHAESQEGVSFLAASGELQLTTPLDFTGSIAGFGGSDVIDLVNTAETVWSFASNVLTVTDNGTTVAKLDFAGSYTQSDFQVGSDQHSGTAITFV